MPKGNIHTSADRATSKFHSNPNKKTTDKMVKETSKRVPTSTVVKRVVYKNGKRSTRQGGY